MHVLSATWLAFLAMEYASAACEYNTTLWPKETRRCAYGLINCVHGYCDGWTEPCKCDLHWTGANCNKLICPGECFETCELCGDTITCPPVKTTTFLESIYTTPSEESINTTIESVTNTTSVSKTNDTWPRGHVCSDSYIMPSEHERFCIGVFCRYGKCVTIRGSKRCSCDLGATGDLCEKPCCKLCGQAYTCMILNGTDMCIENKPGKDKPFKENDKETWYWWVVGVCIGLIVILIFALVVLPYWMWRNRVILIMKIVHYFQKYEDDDERQWDAFISYKSDGEDEAFVLKRLYSKLELDLGFKLCLHFRDFIPGEAIANNIINAVSNSRRTILVLTPRFIESEWTKFEYQQAQHEMLHKKHKIIPIILEDISSVKNNMDKNLQQILSSVTYLQWPDQENVSKEEKFWTRLILSMPKKKSVEGNRKTPVFVDSSSRLSKTEIGETFTYDLKGKSSRMVENDSMIKESCDVAVYSDNGISATSIKPIVF